MHKRIPTFIGLVLVAITIWLLTTSNQFVSNFIQRLGMFGYDLQLQTHLSVIQKKPLSPIAIIDVDEESLQAVGRWPWDRSKLAELVEKLHDLGAAVIAFDIIFPVKERNLADKIIVKLGKENVLSARLRDELIRHESYLDEDTIFGKAIQRFNPILALGFNMERPHKTNDLPSPLITLTGRESAQLNIRQAEGYIGNIPVLQQAAKYSGFISAFSDSDGILRRAPLIIQYENGIYPSIDLQAVMKYLGSGITLVTSRYGKGSKLDGISLGQHWIPTDINGIALIPFVGKGHTFPYYSAISVLNNTLPPEALKGKIVFIGTSTLGLGVMLATSVEKLYPGIEIHATLANGILQNEFSSIPEWTRGAEILVTIAFGLIAAVAFPWFGPLILGLIILFFPAVVLLINDRIRDSTGVVFSFLMPIFLVLLIGLWNIIYGYLFEARRREHLKDIFGQYVPAKHIDEMLKSPDNYTLHGESRELSVLFADIRQFTSISENMTASDLVEMLNAFFTPMTKIIFKHKGTIDKYVGDLVMAFWGAPLKDKLHAQHAIAAALDMQKQLKKMAATKKQHWTDMHVGIGINTGMMNVGDMGSRYRRNYTVLGDAVNLASRVEGLTKFYNVGIIVTENTYENQPDFVFRKLDKVKVKGKKKVVAIYEVICLLSEAEQGLLEELEKWHGALTLYFERKWEESCVIVMELHHEFPDKKIYKIYRDRLMAFRKKPPRPDWDGIYAHVTK